MKIILLLMSVVTLLTAGCIFPGPRGGGEFRERGESRDHREYRHEEHRGDPEPGVDIRIHAP